LDADLNVHSERKYARHKGDIPKGTLKNILKAAGLGEM
jgi:hypothetical protein